ncbi:MAG: acetyl-lysine deacetylase [Thermoprotei archaeon]|nr:MAG: acetyl-lysine deacetylase [Thermoprotei archaeon]
MSSFEVELLLEMLKTYSPTGGEGELAKLLLKHMRDMGFEVHIDGVGNVVGRISGGGPRVLLCGHMDTVPGFIPVKVEDGEVWGRGAVDAKGPLATLILAAKSYVSSSSPSDRLDLTVVGVVEEEGSSKGMYHLLETLEEPAIAVFGEPSGASGLALGYKGSTSFKISIETEKGHSASPWLFKNAIEEAWNLWMRLAEAFNRYRKEGSMFNSLTYCLTSMVGGEGGVFTPSTCTFSFNLRLPPSLRCPDVVDLVERIVEEFRRERGVKVDVKRSDCVEASVTSRSSLVARAFSRAVIEVLNVKPTFTLKTGTSDMNVAATKWRRAEMAAYGPGDSSLDHTPHERLSISEYLSSIRVLARALAWIEKLTRKAFYSKRSS